MRRKTGKKAASNDARKVAQDFIAKHAALAVGATVSFRSADGERILTGEITAVEHHVLGTRLRIRSGDLALTVHVDQLI